MPGEPIRAPFGCFMGGVIVDDAWIAFSGRHLCLDGVEEKAEELPGGGDRCMLRPMTVAVEM